MLTTNQAAALLGLSAARVCQLCNQGRIPGARLFGRQWMVPKRFKVKRVKLGRPIGS